MGPYTATLVTVGEDRTFKVWNLADESLVYRSTFTAAVQTVHAMATKDENGIYDIDGMDLDGNGRLSYAEFSKVLERIPTFPQRSAPLPRMR